MTLIKILLLLNINVTETTEDLKEISVSLVVSLLNALKIFRFLKARTTTTKKFFNFFDDMTIDQIYIASIWLL